MGNDGTVLTGVLLTAPVLTGALATTPALTGVLTTTPVLTGVLGVAVASLAFPNDTVRVKLTALTHDINGLLIAGVTATVTLVRPDNTVAAGPTVATYDAVKGWNATMTIPLAEVAPEFLLARVVAVDGVTGARRTFEGQVFIAQSGR